MGDVKMVITIRKDLKMRAGKTVAQASHASMKVLLDRMKSKPVFHPVHRPTHVEYKLTVKDGSPMYKWITGSFKKIVVYVNSEQELLDIYAQARVAELPCSLIKDSGFTEFHGVPTYTAVAIGPHWSDEIDEITGELPLL